jgi:hypothetical protein
VTPGDRDKLVQDLAPLGPAPRSVPIANGPHQLGSRGHTDPPIRERDFHGERRRNDSHGSTTDPEARLFRKGPGKEARLCFMGHALMENRNGLIVGAVTTTASGYAERGAALALIEPHAMRPQPVDALDDLSGSRDVLDESDALASPHGERLTSTEVGSDQCQAATARSTSS